MQFSIKMPKLSPTMEEGIIVRWLVKEGDYAEADTPILEITTDKATVEHMTLDSGYVRAILVHEGEQAAVNTELAIFTTEKTEAIKASADPKVAVHPEPHTRSPAASIAEVTLPSDPHRKRISISPVAKRRAEQHGIDITTVRGSGPGGRIMLRDIPEKSAEVTKVQNSSPTLLPAQAITGVKKLSPIHQIVAKRLQAAKQQIPHFYLFQRISVDLLVEIREGMKAAGQSLSYNDWMIKAVALAMKQHPEIHFHYDSAHETKQFLSSVDVSFAVEIMDGLITPIIFNADTKSLVEISAEAKDLAEKAKSGRLQSAEFTGGSITISNLGMMGINSFLAIINPPQAMIVSVGAIQEQPVIASGEIRIGKTLDIGISADHRVISGGDAARFLKTLQSLLEAPLQLMKDSIDR